MDWSFHETQLTSNILGTRPQVFRQIHFYLCNLNLQPRLPSPYNSPCIHWFLYFLPMGFPYCPRLALWLQCETLVLLGRGSFLWLHPRTKKLLSHHPRAVWPHHPLLLHCGWRCHPWLLHPWGIGWECNFWLRWSCCFSWDRHTFVQRTNIIMSATLHSCWSCGDSLRNGKRCVTRRDPTHMRTDWPLNYSHPKSTTLDILRQSNKKVWKIFFRLGSRIFALCAFLLRLTLADPRCLLVVSEHPLPHLRVLLNTC